MGEGKINKLIYKGLISSLTYKSTREPDNRLSALTAKRVHQTTKANDRIQHKPKGPTCRTQRTTREEHNDCGQLVVNNDLQLWEGGGVPTPRLKCKQ